MASKYMGTKQRNESLILGRILKMKSGKRAFYLECELTFVKYAKDRPFAFSFSVSKAIFVAESEFISFRSVSSNASFEYHRSHRFHPSFATLVAGCFVAHAQFLYPVWSRCSFIKNPGGANHGGAMAGR